MKSKVTKGVFIWLISSSLLFAQKRVTGEVRDESGPLPGATVVIQNSSVGVVSDYDGQFTLEVNEGDILIASYVGFKDVAMRINQSDHYTFVLLPDNELEEVVVTSLGIKREKKALGYAVSEVGADQIESRPQGDVGRVLAGKASGINVINQSGLSGSGTSIVIRGFSSFSGSNQPLFVVDGVPFASDTNQQQNFVDGNNGSSRFLDLDPNNIASVNVLKGLAAATLYGTQGRNGVILITTKTGSTLSSQGGPSKTEVNVSSSFNFVEIASLPDYQNQYGNGFDQSFGWFFSNWGPSFDQDGRAGWAQQNSINGTASGTPGFLRHPFTTASGATGIPSILNQVGVASDALYEWRPYDNVKDFFRTGTTINTSINLTHRGAAGGISLNYGHNEESGFTPENELRRDALSVGGSANLVNGIRFNGTLNYVNTYFQSPPVAAGFGSNVGGENASIFANIFYTPRSIDLVGLPYQNPVTGESIYYRQNNSIQHPLWTVNNARTIQDTHRVFGSSGLSFDIAQGLTLNYRYGLDIYSEKNTNYSNRGGKTGSVANRSGVYQTWNNTNRIVDHNISLSGNYTLSDPLDLNFTVGYTTRRDVLDRYGTDSVGQQVFGVLRHFNFASQDEREFYRERNIVGLYGTVELGYKNYLYLTLQARQDKVSNLSAANNTIVYPASSVSFLATDAIKGLKSEALGYLKLRAGYGTSANFPIGYPVSSNLILDVQDFQNDAGTDIVTNASANALGNPDLKPERLDELEFGLESRWWNNRLALDLSWYNRKTKDLIVDRPLDPSTGYVITQVNVGQITTKGAEVDLGINWLENDKDWGLESNFNWTTYNPIVDDLGQDTEQIVYEGFTGSSGGNVAIVGEPLGSIWGTTIDRDDQGNFLVNGQGSYVENTDPSIIGNGNPDWQLNWSQRISYKGLSLNWLFRYQQGGDMLSWTVGTLLGRGVTTDTLDRENTFILPGVNAQGQPNNIQINNSTYYFSNILYGPDELRVYDVSHWRIAEIGLTYDFPESIIGNTPFGRASLTLAGYNLAFDAFNTPEGTNFDPNVAGVGVGNGIGLEFLNGPSAKRWGATLKLSF